MLLNLIGNAIKFTDAGAVTVRASASKGSFMVAVHDTGPGISAGDQNRIFEEFQQVDLSATKRKGRHRARSRNLPKRIIEMQGGTLGVESILGQGSTFFFTLPVMVAQQPGQA